ncbi:MAG: tRNA 2-thiouridine synthesizing protein TusA [Rhodobacteraceae bacterium HLUCCA08]|nr:MAG: tRNA 2-thiouridine synthesizing protein TusA [Rhodobacteraceae bacterium HLUCCA08]
MKISLEIDARGLKCPLPVLRASRALRRMAPGQVLRLLADDPMAAIDLPHFCAETGHVMETAADLSDGGRAYLIRCTGA